jgi:hypothetical protein
MKKIDLFYKNKNNKKLNKISIKVKINSKRENF